MLLEMEKMENIKEWYQAHTKFWWLPDIFKDPMCSDPLFPLMLTVFLKLNDNPQMVIRLNTEYPLLDDGVHGEPYRKGLSKEQKRHMSKQDIQAYYACYSKKPDPLDKPEKDIMSRTVLIDDTRLCFLFFKHGLVYNHKSREVTKPDGPLVCVELLPPQPICAVEEHYIYIHDAAIFSKKISLNMDRAAPLRVFPDLSNIESNRYGPIDLLTHAKVELLCKEDANKVFSILLKFNDYYGIDTTELFNHKQFEELVRSMCIPMTEAKSHFHHITTDYADEASNVPIIPVQV